MKRLFAALKIHPDPSFLGSLSMLKGSLGHEAIKWVEADNLHITLKFFGGCEDEKIPAIASVLAERARHTPELSLTLSGLGIFGSRYAPRVIWCGVEPFNPVAELMYLLHDDLEKAGFPGDRQNLVPHLTLGRIRQLHDPVLFRRLIDQYKSLHSKPESIREILLFESILRKEGPLYRIVQRFSLA